LSRIGIAAASSDTHPRRHTLGHARRPHLEVISWFEVLSWFGIPSRLRLPLNISKSERFAATDEFLNRLCRCAKLGVLIIIAPHSLYRF
jgi:hypothetical protein